MPTGEQFISEPLEPLGGTLGTAMAARGEPALPARFRWRDAEYAITRVATTWKTSSREGGRRDGELYLRRHWYRVETDRGETLTIYCDRQARNRSRPKARWFVFSRDV